MTWAKTDLRASPLWKLVWVSYLSKLVRILITTAIRKFLTLNDDVDYSNREGDQERKESVVVVGDLLPGQEEDDYK